MKISQDTLAIKASLCFLVASLSANAAQTANVLFDFSQGIQGWVGNPRVTDLRATSEGLAFRSIGIDPWIESPPIGNVPIGNQIRLTIRMKSTGDGAGEVFWGNTFTPENSRRFFVRPDGEWHEYTILLSRLKPDMRLRIDPANGKGEFVLSRIKAQAIVPLASPDFIPPEPFDIENGEKVCSADVAFFQNPSAWDAWAFLVNNTPIALGHTHSQLGVLINDQPNLIPLNAGPISMEKNANGLQVQTTVQDAEGTTYHLKRTVEPHSHDGTLLMRLSITADRDREIYHLPWVTLFPGFTTFGERKTQAIVSGVEYLEDEPSSSEADFNAEQAERRIVDDYKLTLPMMALHHEGHYMGLVWNRKDHPAAVFDSPDRVFHSGAHLMGLWQPGTGDLRMENQFSVLGTFTLNQDVPLQFEVLLIGDEGKSIVNAIQHYVALRGLPELPSFEGAFELATRLLAGGWLDSGVHEDGLWRHAFWGDSFGPIAAADAPVYMRWLAAHTNEPSLADRLRQGAEKGLARLNPMDNYLVSVSHVTSPAPILILGNIDNNIARLTADARANLAQFDENGLRRWHHADPKRPDYGKTHFTDHANGYNAQVLEIILKAAVFSGAPDLVEAGLRLLDQQTQHYAFSVPRGAQTWEIPLHTPDILASARLINTYVYGYLLSGNESYLDQARYWAWSGVPFLYLDSPVDGQIGTYATISVLGATNWVAPNWIGQPVQWCGLVYASALHALAEVDNVQGDFWRTLATGITLSGLQQTFPLDDQKRQGLLPDFFLLREQYRDGPAINPGTVQARLPEAYGKTPLYSVKRTGIGNMLVHAPGRIDVPRVEDDYITMPISVWTNEPYWIRITGESDVAQIQWRGQDLIQKQRDNVYNASNLLVKGDGTLAIRRSSTTSLR